MECPSYEVLLYNLTFCLSLLAPESEPLYLRGFSPTSRSIYLEWIDIPKFQRNGDLTGYKVLYKKFFDPQFQVQIVPFGFTSVTIEGLKPYTMYQVEVMGFNAAGDGPPDYWVNRTLEDGMELDVSVFFLQ